MKPSLGCVSRQRLQQAEQVTLMKTLQCILHNTLLPNLLKHYNIPSEIMKIFTINSTLSWNFLQLSI